MYIYLNHKIYPEDALPLSELSRALWLSDGVFTTMRVDNGHIVDFESHLLRLKEQASLIDIEVSDLPRDEIERLIDANHASQGLYRLKVIAVPLGDPSCPTWNKKRQSIYLARIDPYQEMIKSIRVKVYPEPVLHPIYPIKGQSYAQRQWLKVWAQKQGYDDALCVDHDGHILELSNSNIFWEKGDTLFTPDFEKLPIFKGLTLKKHIKLSSTTQYVKVKSIPENATCFACNSLHPKVLIDTIDD